MKMIYHENFNDLIEMSESYTTLWLWKNGSNDSKTINRYDIYIEGMNYEN